MIFDLKTILGLLGMAMTIAAHIPYLRHTLNGSNKPHIFTWIIWTLLTFIACAVQVAGQAGPGAWVTGATGVICIFITIAAWRTGEKDITRSDWVTFLAGLAAIPVWAVTHSPLWSILIVSVIDASAFYPTFRKSWQNPFEENTFMYGFNVPRHIVSMLSLRTVSVITALYPALLLGMNALMYVMLKLRRRWLLAQA